MKLLSMVMGVTHQDYSWLLPMFILLIVAWFNRHKKRDDTQEDIIDLYHHQSRELYCTSETCRILTKDEAAKVREARQQNKLIKVRWVDYKEGKKANVWGDGKQTTIYGQQYRIVC